MFLVQSGNDLKHGLNDKYNLPEDQLYSRPEICILYAWALLVSSQNLETADQCLDKIDPGSEIIRGKLTAVRSIQAAFQRNIPEAEKLARQALDQLPDDEYFFRQITGWNLSAALFLSGKDEESVDILEEVARVSLASGNRMVAVVTLSRLGNILLQQGDLYSAYDYYQRAMNIASEDRDRPMPVAGEVVDQVMLSITEGDAVLLEKPLRVLRQNAYDGLESLANRRSPSPDWESSVVTHR